MDGDDLCQRLPWDSQFFGCAIARVQRERLAPREMERIEPWCQAHAIDCLYWLAPAADQEMGALAQTHDFRALDVRLTLQCDQTGVFDGRAPAVRPWQPVDLPRLRTIARSNHTATRFFADRNFPRERCAALYELWLTQSCQRPTDAVFVADCRGEPAGYVTCERRDDGTGSIGLLGVAPAARGGGLGRQLLAAARRWFAGADVRVLRVATQADNIAAVRLYEQAGFRRAAVQQWYHRWFDRPRR